MPFMLWIDILFYLMEIEDQVQFADVSEIFVQNLDEMMNDFEDQKFIISFIDNANKVQACISFEFKYLANRVPFIYDFEFVVFQEIA